MRSMHVPEIIKQQVGSVKMRDTTDQNALECVVWRYNLYNLNSLDYYMKKNETSVSTFFFIDYTIIARGHSLS